MKCLTIILSILFLCWISYNCFEMYQNHKRTNEPIYKCAYYETVTDDQLDPKIRLIQHPIKSEDYSQYPTNVSRNVHRMKCFDVCTTFDEWSNNYDADFSCMLYTHDIYIYKQDNSKTKIVLTTMSEFIWDFYFYGKRFKVNTIITQYISSPLLLTIICGIYLFKKLITS